MAPRRSDEGGDLERRVEAIASALREGAFDPSHAGPVYLRGDAASAIRETIGDGADVMVAGETAGDLPGAGFMGMRVVPDLAIYPPGLAPHSDDRVPLDLFGGGRSKPDHSSGGIAVTITVLRQDARAAQGAIADAVFLATRYDAVVVLILDRRLGGRDPFGGGGSPPQGLSSGDRRLVDALAREHGITVVVRRQDPFGFG